MAQNYITRIRTEKGDLPIDFYSLYNLPAFDTKLDGSDESTGFFADAKAVGDRLNDMYKKSDVDSKLATINNNITNFGNDRYTKSEIDGKMTDVNAKIDANTKSINEHDHKDKEIKLKSIEFSPTVSEDNNTKIGGLIDFHHPDALSTSTEEQDCTSRIVEKTKGAISVEAKLNPCKAIILVEGETYGTLEQRPQVGEIGQIFFVKATEE